MLAASPAILIMAGFVAGLFGSLLGLGGGWLMVPVLTSVGLPTLTAVGTSLTAMVVTTSVSTYQYHRKGHLQLKLALAFGLPSVLGVQAGKLVLNWLYSLGVDGTAVGAFYVGLLLFNGTGMLRRAWRSAAREDATATESRRLPSFGPTIILPNGTLVPLYMPVAGGAVAGVLSGVLGIGGGIVLVPMMSSLLGLPIITAVATSLVSVLISASFGAASYFFAGDVDSVAALSLAAGALAGGYIGVSLSHHARENAMRVTFAALTYTTATAVVLRLAGHSDISQILLFGSAAVLGALCLGSLVWAAVKARKAGVD